MLQQRIPGAVVSDPHKPGLGRTACVLARFYLCLRALRVCLSVCLPVARAIVNCRLTKQLTTREVSPQAVDTGLVRLAVVSSSVIVGGPVVDFSGDGARVVTKSPRALTALRDSTAVGN